MRRTLLVLLSVLVGVVLLAVVALLLLGPLLGLDRPADFASPGVLRIDLSGPLVERAPQDLFAAGLEGESIELLDVALALERAATDDRIAGVVLRVESPGYGWAKAEEIRDRLATFRASGKFVHAYVPTTDELGYYVAVAADRIDVLPDAALELNGFRIETPFIRETLEKLGLEAQVEAVGSYKSAADLLQRDNMSDAEREVTTAILRERHDRFVDAVVAGRRVDRARLDAALDRGVYLARDLAALGLIDGQAFERDVLRRAVAEARGGAADAVTDEDVARHLVDLDAYAAALPDPPGRPAGTIGLVYAVGAITGGESGYDPLFGRTMGSETVLEMLNEVAADEELEAVVLRIESPGGDALASAEIWSGIAALSERLPVVASMGDVAGSGGYYVAVAADRIVAAPSTITGSIGVLGVLFNAAAAWERLGVHWEALETSPAAAFPTSTRPLTPAERETFRVLIEDTYRTFVRRVAEGRGRPVSQIEPVARGRIWTGSQAVGHGLVDEVGGLAAAIAAAKEAAGMAADDAVRLHVYPGTPSLLERVREALGMQRLGEAAAHPAPAALPLARELGRRLTGMAAAVRDARRPLTVMPHVPRIR